MNEFDLIRKIAEHQTLSRDDVVTGIGDDAAVVRPPAGMEQVISSDVLVAGIHFPNETDAVSIGHKSLAVNLSDLAAMGATPAWFSLNLSLPQADENWLRGFCQGMFGLALEYGMQLIGGDTVRGPLVVGIQVHGFVPEGRALLRSGAAPGDAIFVTGALGDAGAALMHLHGDLSLQEGERAELLQRLNRPTPRVRAGLALRGIAGSCIDISDGLLADLGHILEASGVGAAIQLDDVPLSPAYRAHFSEAGGWDTALGNGDDYELCFTVPAERLQALEDIRESCGCPLTRIGEILGEPGLRLEDAAGSRYESSKRGHVHFAT